LTQNTKFAFGAVPIYACHAMTDSLLLPYKNLIDGTIYIHFVSLINSLFVFFNQF